LQCLAEVAALSTRCIKSDKLNFNEFPDDFAWRRQGQNLFKSFTVFCSAL